MWTATNRSSRSEASATRQRPTLPGNLAALGEAGIGAFIPPDRQSHSAAPPPAPVAALLGAAGLGPAPDPPEADAAGDNAAKAEMRAKLRTPGGRAAYALRKQTVEPVFGQIKEGRGLRRFLLRGLAKVNGEWTLWCLTHNLLKIARALRAIGGLRQQLALAGAG